MIPKIESKFSFAVKSFGRALAAIAVTEGGLAITNIIHNPADWRVIGIGFVVALGKGALSYFTVPRTLEIKDK